LDESNEKKCNNVIYFLKNSIGSISMKSNSRERENKTKNIYIKRSPEKPIYFSSISNSFCSELSAVTPLKTIHD